MKQKSQVGRVTENGFILAVFLYVKQALNCIHFVLDKALWTDISKAFCSLILNQADKAQFSVSWDLGAESLCLVNESKATQSKWPAQSCKASWKLDWAACPVFILWSSVSTLVVQKLIRGDLSPFLFTLILPLSWWLCRPRLLFYKLTEKKNYIPKIPFMQKLLCCF